MESIKQISVKVKFILIRCGFDLIYLYTRDEYSGNQITHPFVANKQIKTNKNILTNKDIRGNVIS